MQIQFNNTYTKLPASFYTRLNPTPVINPVTLCFNHQLASELGISLDNSNDKEIAAIFSGNEILEGSEPIALAYAGHQFGHFVPQLGDGRAILLGEIIDNSGIRRDIQLKGSGNPTFSKRRRASAFRSHDTGVCS